MTQPSKLPDKFDHLLLEGNNANNSVLAAYYDWLPNRKEAVKRLNSLAGELDKSHKNANRGTMVGSGASALGGGAFIAGLALAPFTGGLSAILTIGGTAASVLGSATSVVSSLIEMGITKWACEDVQSLIDRDKIYTKRLFEKLEQFDTIRNDLEAFIKNTRFTDEQLVEMANRATILCKKTAIGKIVLAAICGLISCIAPVAFLLLKCLEMMGFETKMLKDMIPTIGNTFMDTGKNLFRAPANLSKAARFGLGVIAGLFLTIDIWTMVSVHKEMKNGSKSKTGTKFRELAQSMETEMDSVEKMIEQWRKDYPGLKPWNS